MTHMTDKYIFIYTYVHTYMYFFCMYGVWHFIYAMPVQKIQENSCWIFNANIKQKIVFLLPDDLCERFIRVERICILDTFVSRDNNVLRDFMANNY